MNKFKRMASLLVSLSVVAAALTGCGGKTDSGATDAADSADGSFPSMNIEIAHVNPTTDTDQYQKLATLFADKVTERTNGAVTFTICGNSELGKEDDVLTGFDLGTHQAAIMTNGAFANLYGPSNVLEMPFLLKDNETAWKFLDSDVMKEVCDGLYDKLGFKVLGYGEGGFRNTLSQKPIREPADLAGLKMRIPEYDTYIKTYQLLGASPTPMPFSETFTAVQQGTIDALELPIASTYSGSYYEVCKDYSLDGHFYNAISICLSRSLWESLSPELQEIFQTAADEATHEQREWLQGVADGMLDEMEAAGCTIVRDVDVAAFQEAVAPIYESYRETIGSDLLDRALELVK